MSSANQDVIFNLQRLSTLCKLLGRGEDTLKKTFQSLSSSESLDFRSVLYNDVTSSSPSTVAAPPPPAPASSDSVHQSSAVAATGHSSNLSVNTSFSNNVDHEQSLLTAMRKESDSESGFEDGSSSQMSRSLAEDPGTRLGALCESESVDCLQVGQMMVASCTCSLVCMKHSH